MRGEQMEKIKNGLLSIKGTMLQKANIKTKESGVEHMMGQGLCSTGGKQASRR